VTIHGLVDCVLLLGGSSHSTRPICSLCQTIHQFLAHKDHYSLQRSSLVNRSSYQARENAVIAKLFTFLFFFILSLDLLCYSSCYYSSLTCSNHHSTMLRNASDLRAGSLSWCSSPCYAIMTSLLWFTLLLWCHHPNRLIIPPGSEERKSSLGWPSLSSRSGSSRRIQQIPHSPRHTIRATQTNVSCVCPQVIIIRHSFFIRTHGSCRFSDRSPFFNHRHARATW
jgi:hypothetical protein